MTGEVDQIKQLPKDIKVLNFIDELRTVYGLKQNDYSRYHKFCNNKLFKLRKQLNIHQSGGVKKGEKLVTFVQLDENKKIDLTKNSKFFELLIIHAERSLSLAFLKKSQLVEDSRKRQGMLAKFKKATIYAKHLLENFSNAELSDISKVQLQIYVLILNGYYCFEKEEWQLALDNFTITKFLLEKLVSLVGLNSSEQTVYYELINSIEPNLRFCHYNLSRDYITTTQPDQIPEKYVNLVKDLQVKANEGNKGIDTIQWFGSKLPLPTTELKRQLNKATEAYVNIEESIESSEIMKHFDTMTMAYSEASQACQDLQKPTSGSASTDRDGTLKLLTACCKYRLQVSMVRRYRYLLGHKLVVNNDTPVPQLKVQSPLDPVLLLIDNSLHALATIAENLTELDDQDKNAYITTSRLFFDALNYVAMALTFIGDDIHRMHHALPLLNKAILDLSQLAAQRTAIPSNMEGQDIIVTEKDITQLLQATQSRALQVQAALAIHNQNKADQSTEKFNVLDLQQHQQPKLTQTAVIENLERYPADTDKKGVQLVNLDLNLKAIPNKPIVFDLAFNYFQDKDESSAFAKVQPMLLDDKTKEDGKSQGITGILSSLFR